MIFPPKYFPGEIVYFDGSPKYQVVIGKIQYASHDTERWSCHIDGYTNSFSELDLHRLGDDKLTPIAF